MPEVVAQFAGHCLTLLPERAAFDAAARSLFVADLHLGKADAIAATGVPMPPRAIAECWTRDLDRLLTLARRLDTRHLYLLGDLLHARSSRSHEALAALADFAAAIQCPITLVRGNHDLHAGDPPTASGIRCVDEPFACEGLILRHHPPSTSPDAHTLTLCGHIHPAIRLGGAGLAGDRAACFHLSAAGVLTLPAFGSLTGSKVIQTSPGDRAWLVGPDALIEIPWTAAAVRAGRPRRLV